MKQTARAPVAGRTVRGRALGLSIMTAALGASATVASAADDAARAAMDRMRYARSFGEIHDRLAAAEASRAGTPATAAPWTSAGTPPPRAAAREVPAAAYRATVAYASAGSWRGAGDPCTMAPTGMVRVLGSTPDLGALVRYGRPGAAAGEGADACADGTIAFVPTDTLFAWPSVGASEAERRAVGSRLAAAAGHILSDAHLD